MGFIGSVEDLNRIWEMAFQASSFYSSPSIAFRYLRTVSKRYGCLQPERIFVEISALSQWAHFFNILSKPEMTSRIVLILLLASCAAGSARAQQTIFNVPSQDVLAPGTVYGELDVPFRLDAPKYYALTPRVVIGYGYNFEGGINLPGYINVGDKLWTGIVTLKHGQSLDTTGPWTLTEGAHLYVPFTSGPQVGVFGYVMTGYKLFGRLRLDGGVYGATNAVTGRGNELGALGSVELSINDWLTVAVDGYSGKNPLGYVTPGLFVGLFGHWIFYPAYQFSNVSWDGDSYLFEAGYTF